MAIVDQNIARTALEVFLTTVQAIIAEITSQPER